MPAGIRSVHVLASMRGMEAIGVPARELAARAGVDLARLSDPEHYVAAEKMHALWELASQAHGEPDCGLRVGASIPGGAFEVMDYLLPSCATVGQAFEAMVRFFQIATTTARYRLVDRPSEPVIRCESELLVPGTVIHPQARDFAFSALADRFRRMHPGFRLAAVELRGPPIAPSARYDEAFGCPVSFDHPTSCLVVPRDVWELTLPGNDAGLRGILERHAGHVARKAPSSDLLERARAELAIMLGEGRAEVAVLARRLGMGQRTLQRRLAERGVPYSSLLDQARLSLARMYLDDQGLGVDEIAALLGYSEPSAFTRAFRRWTGVSPRAYRRRASAEPPTPR